MQAVVSSCQKAKDGVHSLTVRIKQQFSKTITGRLVDDALDIPAHAQYIVERQRPPLNVLA
jgi:hypothetical protein